MNIYVVLKTMVSTPMVPPQPTIYIHCEDADMALAIGRHVFGTNDVKVLSYSVEPYLGGLIYDALKHQPRGYVDTRQYGYSDYIGTKAMLDCPFVEYKTRQEKITGIIQPSSDVGLLG